MSVGVRLIEIEDKSGMVTLKQAVSYFGVTFCPGDNKDTKRFVLFDFKNESVF